MTETKRCNECREYKPTTEFTKSAAKCRPCRARLQRERRANRTMAQRARDAERDRQWRERNKDAVKAANRKWIEDNPEKYQLMLNRKSYREWTKRIAELEKEIEGYENADEFFRRAYCAKEEQARERLAELRQNIAKLEAKGITAEVAAVDDDSPARRGAEVAEWEITDQMRQSKAVRVAWARKHPNKAALEAARTDAGRRDILLGMKAAEYPEQMERDTEAYNAAHRAGLKAAGGSRGNAGDVYRAAFSAAYDEAWSSITDDPLFEYRPEDIEAVEREVAEMRRRDDAAADLLDGPEANMLDDYAAGDTWGDGW